MKLRDDMLFGHPVLSKFSDDYIEGLLQCSFEVEVDEKLDNLVVVASVEVVCADLAKLIAQGDAGCGYYIVCRRTYQNRLVEIVPGSAREHFEASKFFGTVEVRPVVWSKAGLTNWRSSSLHPEYGGRITFPPGAILALGGEFRFTVDRARLKPFESIFALSADESVPAGEFRVDPDASRIMILAHPDTKSGMDELRIPDDGKVLLLSSVYLPAVMEVLGQLAGAEGLYEDHPWYRVFAAKCAQLGITPESNSTLEDAQRLLAAPFSRLDEAKERLFS